MKKIFKENRVYCLYMFTSWIDYLCCICQNFKKCWVPNALQLLTLFSLLHFFFQTEHHWWAFYRRNAHLTQIQNINHSIFNELSITSEIFINYAWEQLWFAVPKSKQWNWPYIFWAKYRKALLKVIK